MFASVTSVIVIVGIVNPRRVGARVTVLGLSVCLSVCLLPVFLGDGKLIRRTEGTKRFGATLRSFIRTDFSLNASFYSNGVICLPQQRSVLLQRLVGPFSNNRGF